jgi:hypothetical protein
MLILNPHQLQIGCVYKITQPVYDDFNEGLQPEIVEWLVIKKMKSGFLMEHVEHKFTTEFSFEELLNCTIELSNNGLHQIK